MDPKLLTLEHLSYIVECLAENIVGEAKTELSNLSNKLKSNKRFEFQGCYSIAESLDEAESLLSNDMERTGTNIACKINRTLWKEVLEEDEG